MGPVARAETRAHVVERLLVMLRDAAGRGAELVVFPELALTTFFPRWDLADDELLTFFEREMPSADDAAAVRRGARGSASASTSATPSSPPTVTATTRRSLVERDGRIVAKYRKVHLPGHEEPEAWRPFQHLERKYFEPGPGGVPRAPRVRRHRRHRDLQRPAVARDLPRARPPGCRADLHRVQHADPLRARSRPGPSRRASTTTS